MVLFKNGNPVDQKADVATLVPRFNAYLAEAPAADPLFKVLPETLPRTYERLRAALARLAQT